MKKKIVNVKGYKNLNLGDDLFFSILFKRYPNVRFIFLAKKQYKTIFKSHKNVFVITPYSFIDILISCINKIINTITSSNDFDLISFISDYELLIIGSGFSQNRKGALARENRYIDKELILGANFGPYFEESYLNSWKEYFPKCKDVCFRDKLSLNLFSDCEKVRFAPDIVFGIENYFNDFHHCSFLENNNLTKDNYAIISVISFANRTKNVEKANAYYEGIKKISKFLMEKGIKILYFSFCKDEGDLEAIHEILQDNLFANNVSLYNYDGNITEALSIINNSNTIIATRFHAIILGLTMKKKVLPIIYSQKSASVLEDLNWNGLCCSVDELKSLNNEQLENWYENYTYRDFSYEKDLSNNHFLESDKLLD